MGLLSKEAQQDGPEFPCRHMLDIWVCLLLRTELALRRDAKCLESIEAFVYRLARLRRLQSNRQWGRFLKKLNMLA